MLAVQTALDPHNTGTMALITVSHLFSKHVIIYQPNIERESDKRQNRVPTKSQAWRENDIPRFKEKEAAPR